MAQQFEYETIVYFGDSLSDDGNIYEMTSQVLPFGVPPAPYAGKFSNGSVWTEYAASQLSVGEYLNYAIGGAEAVGEKTLEEFIGGQGLTGYVLPDADEALLETDINLSAQVERFLAETAGQDLSEFSASILIGANDYRDFQPTSLETAYQEASELVTQVVTSTMQSVLQLLYAGVGQVIVNTLPPASFFPETSDLGPLQVVAELLVEAHNDALTYQVQQLQDAGFNVTIVDLGAMAGEIVADPGTFGFIAPLEDSVLYDGPLADYDPDQIAFFDEVHPTTAGHGVLGIFQAESLTSNVEILGDGDDVLATGEDDDLVLASGGNDTVHLGDGDDVALGGLGNDVLYGEQADDLLSGGSGNDELSGGRGNDFLAGGSGDDTLNGGRGRDVIIDGLGSDTAFGGQGNDQFLFIEAGLIGGEDGVDHDTFDGGNGFDTLYLALSAETRDAAEASLDGGADICDVLEGIGITALNIEDVVFVDQRTDLASIEADAPIEEADLWGFV